MFFSKMVHIFMQDSYVVMTYVSPPLVPAKRQRSKEVGDTDAKRSIPFAYAKTIRVLVSFRPVKIVKNRFAARC